MMLAAYLPYRHMPSLCQNPDHMILYSSAESHPRLTFIQEITSNQGSKGRSPWPGVQGAGWPLAARRVGDQPRLGQWRWGERRRAPAA